MPADRTAERRPAHPRSVTEANGGAHAARAWSVNIWFLTGAIAIARLVLTGDRDILALNQPYDDYWFVSTAYRGIWEGSYDHLVFAQLQAYAVWLKLMMVIGVPGRLSIDLFWLGGSAYLALAVGRFCGSRWPAIGLFTFLAFHPYSIALFDRALSENLAACIGAIALAAMLDVWTWRRDGPKPAKRKHAASMLVALIAFAIAYHLRKEGVVLLAPLLLLAGWSLVHRRLWWHGLRSPALGILIGPAVATLALGLVLAGANEWRWGVFARYELAAPGYVKAVQALNAIDPQGPTPRWVTVTAATRARAYDVSPTFRELRPYLDGPAVESVVAQTERYSGVKGEIGNGWFYWTLRDMAAVAGWHRTAPAAEAKYRAMASEIEDAFEDGRLGRRSAPIPFVDPDWRKWLPLFPAACLGELRQVVAPLLEDLSRPPEDATSLQQTVYAMTVGRRSAFERASISGWLIAPRGTRIGLGDAATSETTLTLDGPQRPDVPGAFPFTLSASTSMTNAVLHVTTPDGAHAEKSLTLLAAGKMQRLEPLPEATVGIDSVSSPRPAPRADRWLPVLCLAWSALGWVLSIAGMIAIVLVGRTERPSERATRLVLILLAAAIIARAALLGLLDSSSWSGTQARYLLPAVPLFATFGMLGLWKLAERTRGSAPSRTGPSV